MQAQKPCEQFGPDRCQEIDSLIEAATGKPCPGRQGERCHLEPAAESAAEEKVSRLRVIAS